MPNDEIRLLIEMLQPLGPSLARRWLGALMMVDRDEREQLVDEIEAQIVSLYDKDAEPLEIKVIPGAGKAASVAQGRKQA